MRIIYILMLLCLPAMAQRKLWTWTSPHADEEGFSGVVHASATDAKGYTALIIGEMKRLWPEPIEFTRYRLLWISPAGSILHEELVDRPGQQDHEVLNLQPSEPWSILVVSQSLFAVTDSRNVWMVSLKGKAKTRRMTVVPDDEVAVPASSLPVFNGWLQMKGGGGCMIYLGGKEGCFFHATAVSLWAVR